MNLIVVMFMKVIGQMEEELVKYYEVLIDYQRDYTFGLLKRNIKEIG